MDIDSLLNQLAEQTTNLASIYSQISTILANDVMKLKNNSTTSNKTQINTSFTTGNSRVDSSRVSRLVNYCHRDVIHRDSPISQTSGENPAVQALKTLGQLLYSSRTAVLFTSETAGLVVQTICHGLKSRQDKLLCSMAAWCISVHNFSAELMIPHLQSLLSAFNDLLTESPHRSSLTVVRECVMAINKLYARLNLAMKSEENVNIWLPILLDKLLCPDIGTREKVHRLITSVLPHLRPPPANVSEFLFEQMATPNTGLLARMNELMLKYCLPIEGQQPTSTDTASDEWVLAVINSWGPYVHLLGHKIFQQNLINALLKIPERTFLHPNATIRLATWQAWQCLADNFTFQKGGIVVPKRIKLLMLPIINCLATDTDIKVKQEAISTWHFLLKLAIDTDGCRSDASWDQYFQKPLLDAIFDKEENSDSIVCDFLTRLADAVKGTSTNGQFHLLIHTATSITQPDRSCNARAMHLLHNIVIKAVKTTSFMKLPTYRKAVEDLLLAIINRIISLLQEYVTKDDNVSDASECIQLLIDFLHQFSSLQLSVLFEAADSESSRENASLQQYTRVNLLIDSVSIMVEKLAQVQLGQTGRAILFESKPSVKIGGGRETCPLGGIFARSCLQVLWSAEWSSQTQHKKLDLFLSTCMDAIFRALRNAGSRESSHGIAIRSCDILLAELWYHLTDNLLPESRQSLTLLAKSLLLGQPINASRGANTQKKEAEPYRILCSYVNLWKIICQQLQIFFSESQSLSERSEVGGRYMGFDRTSQPTEHWSQIVASKHSIDSSLGSTAWLFAPMSDISGETTMFSSSDSNKSSTYIAELIADAKNDDSAAPTVLQALDSILNRPFHVFYKAVLWPLRLMTCISSLYMHYFNDEFSDIPSNESKSKLGESLMDTIVLCIKPLIQTFYRIARLKEYTVDTRDSQSEPSAKLLFNDNTPIATVMSTTAELMACVRLLLRICMSKHTQRVLETVGATRLSALLWLKLVLPCALAISTISIAEMIEVPVRKANPSQNTTQTVISPAFWRLPTRLKVKRGGKREISVPMLFDSTDDTEFKCLAEEILTSVPNSSRSAQLFAITRASSELLYCAAWSASVLDSSTTFDTNSEPFTKSSQTARGEHLGEELLCSALSSIQAIVDWIPLYPPSAPQCFVELLSTSAKSSTPSQAAVGPSELLWHLCYYAIKPSLNLCLITTINTEQNCKPPTFVDKDYSKLFHNEISHVILPPKSRRAMDELWDTLTSKLKKAHTAAFDSAFLHTVDDFIVLGFKCKQRHIKNATIDFWNSTFGSALSGGGGTKVELIYPVSLLKVLAELREKIPEAELRLPGGFADQLKAISRTVSDTNSTSSKGPVPEKAISQIFMDADILAESSALRPVCGDVQTHAVPAEVTRSNNLDSDSEDDSNDIESISNSKASASSCNGTTDVKNTFTGVDSNSEVTSSKANSSNRKAPLTERQREMQRAQRMHGHLGGVKTYTEIDQSYASVLPTQTLSLDQDDDLPAELAKSPRKRNRQEENLEDQPKQLFQDNDSEAPRSPKRRKLNESSQSSQSSTSPQVAHWNAAIEMLCGIPDLNRVLDAIPTDQLVATLPRLLNVVTQISTRLAQNNT